MATPDRLDVDARFLLANERTLLAWVRTALTLLAGGFAVEQLSEGSVASTPLAAGLLVAGTASVITGGVRYRRADEAIRAGRLPPTGRSPYALVVAVTLLALLGTAVLLLT